MLFRGAASDVGDESRFGTDLILDTELVRMWRAPGSTNLGLGRGDI